MWAIWSSSTSSKNVIQETGQEKSDWLLGTTSQSWSCWSSLLFFTLLQSKIHVPLLSTPNMDNCRLLSSSSCYGHSASTDVVGTIQERKPLQTLEQEQEWVLSPSWLWRTGGRSPPHPVFLLWLGLHQRETCEIHPGLLHQLCPSPQWPCHQSMQTSESKLHPVSPGLFLLTWSHLRSPGVWWCCTGSPLQNVTDLGIYSSQNKIEKTRQMELPMKWIFTWKVQISFIDRQIT